MFVKVFWSCGIFQDSVIQRIRDSKSCLQSHDHTTIYGTHASYKVKIVWNCLRQQTSQTGWKWQLSKYYRLWSLSLVTFL